MEYVVKSLEDMVDVVAGPWAEPAWSSSGGRRAVVNCLWECEWRKMRENNEDAKACETEGVDVAIEV